MGFDQLGAVTIALCPARGCFFHGDARRVPLLGLWVLGIDWLWCFLGSGVLLGSGYPKA